MESNSEGPKREPEQIRLFGNNIRSAIAEVRHYRNIWLQEGAGSMFRKMFRDAAMSNSGYEQFEEGIVEPGWRSSQFVDDTGRVTAIRDSDGIVHPIAKPRIVESLLDKDPDN